MLLEWLEPYYRQFVSSVRAGRMPSSVIIAGHEGLGGKLLALEMAKYVLCHHPSEHGPCNSCPSCSNFARLTNMDCKVAYTSSTDEESSGYDFTHDLSGLIVRPEIKQARTMRIDTMRKITGFLNESAVGGSHYKVVIIAGAELMSEGAANAILKTFEEPSKNSLIIMLTKSLEVLLPTILSRASKMVIKDVPIEQAFAYLMNPSNQVPPIIRRVDGDEAEYNAQLQAAKEQCAGLNTPITHQRAAIALALSANAPLSAMKMLLSGDDLKATEVVNALVQSVTRGDAYEVEVMSALKALTNQQQVSLLRTLILEVLKYKAYVPVEQLPLVNYCGATVLERLQLDRLFEAMELLKHIEDRPPLIPARAPKALIRSWLKGFKADANMF
ncbi:MAG: hypothetical protein SOV16_08940 [Anaerobiospirillum succiniciproducens]|uniref:hypothetical protein n=1 Tax=Anaerobiospirillum succiniciproducens TaxID=13335 RepID=UPI002A75E549|nr:hypothetical protein [Anaerobiospirillum succiniciproducens]MDY2799265.1 hypothetical protein [Anaerobiospirillum succiniciproducens]